MAFNLAGWDKHLSFQESGPKGQAKQSRGGSKVKLGIMPNFGKSENKGLRVDGVTPGGPANLGGMLKGDIITAIAGKEINNIYEYMARLNKLKPGQTITVDVLRNEEKLVLLIQLEE